MPKTTATAVLHEPLSAILGTRAKVAVLRLLSRSGVAIPHREVARRSGMAYRSIALALADLIAAGVVAEVPGGRERRVELATGHRLTAAIASVLRAESDFFPSLRTELKALALGGEGDGLLTLSLVGAVARREEGVGDPLELVLVGVDRTAAVRWRERLEEGAEALSRRFGVSVRVIGYDLAEARKLWITRTARAEAMVRSAELLVGASLLGLVEAVA